MRPGRDFLIPGIFPKPLTKKPKSLTIWASHFQGGRIAVRHVCRVIPPGVGMPMLFPNNEKGRFWMKRIRNMAQTEFLRCFFLLVSAAFLLAAFCMPDRKKC